MIKTRNIGKRALLDSLGKWLCYDLSAGAANAFALVAQNPYAEDVIIDRAIVKITTAGGTATAVGDPRSGSVCYCNI
jgi:hypothetical protein